MTGLPKGLNLGCGRDYRKGFHNVDRSPLVKTDERLDLFRFPWPLPSNHFEIVMAHDLLEHVPHYHPDWLDDGLVMFLNECHRVLQPGGALVARFPQEGHRNNLIDPTHTRVLTRETFEWFFQEGGQSTWLTDRLWKIASWKHAPDGNAHLRMQKVEKVIA